MDATAPHSTGPAADPEPKRFGQSYDLMDYRTGESVQAGALHSLPAEKHESFEALKIRAERWRATLAKSYGATCAMILYRWRADEVVHADIILLTLPLEDCPDGFLRYIAPELAEAAQLRRSSSLLTMPARQPELVAA